MRPQEWPLRGADCVDTLRDMVAREYKVFLEPDVEYGGYVVVSPSLPGTYSQGKTVSEALQIFGMRSS